MSQSAQDFALRLAVALDGNPTAPEAQYGRLSWLQRELKKGTGISVSVNTVHKWVNGASLPRPDNIRALARVLKVDEVWLALGRKPGKDPAETKANASRASGAALLLGGLIEMSGGKVMFASAGEVSHLRASFGGQEVGLIAVCPQEAEGKASFVIPEPVGTNRVVAVRQFYIADEGCLCIQAVDITKLPRQSLGGFSVLQLDISRDGKLKAPGTRASLHPVRSILELVGA